jgi:hypothetical protein
LGIRPTSCVLSSTILCVNELFEKYEKAAMRFFSFCGRQFLQHSVFCYRLEFLRKNTVFSISITKQKWKRYLFLFPTPPGHLHQNYDFILISKHFRCFHWYLFDNTDQQNAEISWCWMNVFSLSSNLIEQFHNEATRRFLKIQSIYGNSGLAQLKTRREIKFPANLRNSCFWHFQAAWMCICFSSRMNLPRSKIKIRVILEIWFLKVLDSTLKTFCLRS